MVEAKIAKVKNKEAYLKTLLQVIKNGVSDDTIKKFPEFKEELEDMKYFFNEDKFFIESARLNKRNLRDKFQSSDLERALNFFKGEKIKRHLEKKVEEAIGFREIAKGDFENYNIVVYQKEVVIRGESLKEKVNLRSFFLNLTQRTGFKQIQNKYKKAIIERAQIVIELLKKNDTYDETLLDISLLDEEEKTKLNLKLACVIRKSL